MGAVYSLWWSSTDESPSDKVHPAVLTPPSLVERQVDIDDRSSSPPPSLSEYYVEQAAAAVVDERIDDRRAPSVGERATE